MTRSFDTTALRAWSPGRHRLARFAAANRFRFDPEPHGPRPAAHIFGSAPVRGHSDLIEVPDPYGFTVANYAEVWPEAGDDGNAFRAGYAIFRLRESHPHTLVSRDPSDLPRPLRRVEPVAWGRSARTRETRMWSLHPDGPLLQLLLASGVVAASSRIQSRLEIEIIGHELFLLHTGSWALTSPRLWAKLGHVADCLAPFLVTTAPVEGGSTVELVRDVQGPSC